MSRCSSLASVAWLLSASGCFAVADLGRFHPGASQASDATTPDAADEGGVDDPTQPSGLVLTLVNMGVHFQQLIEARVIDSQNGIQSRIMIQPLDRAGATKITVRVPSAMPPEGSPYRLDFYGDVDYSGTYSGLGNVLTHDHAWRIDPLVDYPANQFPHVANETQVTFLHSTAFTDIDTWNGMYNPPRDTGLSARVRFNTASLAAYQGRLLQMDVRETRGAEHTVAVYRIPAIPGVDAGANFEAVLPGVLDDGFDYFLKIYIDANGNGIYDDPSVPSADADLGFSIPVRSMVSAAMAPEAGTSGGADTDAPPDAGADPDAAAPAPAPDAGGLVFGIDIAFDLTTTPFPSDQDVGAPD